MQCLDARIASFAAITRPKRSAKIAFPLDAKTYPHLTPNALAMAGFYHFPSADADDPDADDTCKCFLCELVLGGWDTDDNPFVEHVKRDSECAWKEIVCRLEVDRMQGGPGRMRTVFPDADSLPNSARNTTLREETFGSWWPHKVPTAKKVAEAGFIFTPSKQSPDGTSCPLCKYEVVDWEAGDDPMDVHKRKNPSCPFFTATAEKKAPASKRGKQTARRGRSTTTSTRGAEPKEIADDSLELPDPEAMEKAMEEEEAAPKPRRGRQTKASLAASLAASTSDPPATRRQTKASLAAASLAASTSEPPASSRSTKSAASSTARGGRRKATKKEEEIEEEQEPESSKAEAEPEPEPEVEPKRATKPLPRKRTTRATGTVEPAQPEEPAPAPAPKPRGRPKKTATATTEETASAPVREAPALGTSTRGKSAPTRTKAKPLAQADSIANVPPPSAVMSPKSPSVRHAVASMVREASPVQTPVKAAPAAPAPATPPAAAPGPAQSAPSEPQPAPPAPPADAKPLPPLTDEQRKMTLEEYIRQQYALRATEMRADGEAMIQKFEAAAKAARAQLERG